MVYPPVLYPLTRGKSATGSAGGLLTCSGYGITQPWNKPPLNPLDGRFYEKNRGEGGGRHPAPILMPCKHPEFAAVPPSDRRDQFAVAAVMVTATASDVLVAYVPSPA